jgi:hypothetical protein
MTQIIGIATDSRNLDGRAQAITVLTPIKPGWTLWLRYNFFFGRHVLYFTKKLRMLSFIHYARWSIVTRIAENGPPQQPERLIYNYLLFTTNFNGTWDQYIDAFSEIIPWRIRMIWTSSFGFPGPLPAERFKDYIRKNEFVTNHYYAAYPQASTTQVLSALELCAKFERFTSGVREDIEADDFRSAWLTFLTDVQMHL